MASSMNNNERVQAIEVQNNGQKDTLELSGEETFMDRNSGTTRS